MEVWDRSSQSVRGNADPIPKKKSTHRPNFIEEIMEDTDTSSKIVEIGVYAGLGGKNHTDVNNFSDCLNVTILCLYLGCQVTFIFNLIMFLCNMLSSCIFSS